MVVLNDLEWTEAKKRLSQEADFRYARIMYTTCSAHSWCLVFLLIVVVAMTEAKVCRSINARNGVEDLKQLENCTVVEGFVMVVLMERTDETEFELYNFPQLREITHFLMFYRVKGLQSIGGLFPNLEKIGGDSLFQDYALVVFEMYHLRNIGLRSLSEISKGSVIILKNRNLCYVDTVNWDRITKRMTVANYKNDNHDQSSCPHCDDSCESGYCWSSSHCQVEPEARNCHSMCVGSCHGPSSRDCFSCRGVLAPNGSCVARCPSGTYQYAGRRCVSREECLETPLCAGQNTPMCIDSSTTGHHVIFENKCLESCPQGYDVGAGSAECEVRVWCVNGQHIASVADSENLRGCTHINGSLEITIKTPISPEIRSQLEENLGSIEEIKGHLKVFRSSLTDLKFLKNLTIIHGISIDYDNIALYVFENNNLQELWDWDLKRNLTVFDRRLFFHYNPKLCLQHIYKLLDVINYENVSDYEIGKESNGDKFPCNASLIDIKVLAKTSDSITVRVPYFQAVHNAPELYYVIFYKKDLYKTFTKFDDLDQCSDYSWRTKDIPFENTTEYDAHGFRVNLTYLEPSTQYAFYVITYVGNRIGAQSPINYAKTLPTTPSDLVQLKAWSKSSSEIVLQWKPPKRINGQLVEYVVTWFPLEEDRYLLANRDYCTYPMDTKDLKINVTSIPKTVKKNKDCCLNIMLPKDLNDGFQKLCTQGTTFPDKEKLFSYCEAYLNSFIYKNPLETNTYQNKNKMQNLKEPNSLNSVDLEGVRNKYMKSQSHNKDSYFREVNKQVNGLPSHSFGTKITGLKNFQDYVILVKACRAIHPDELDVPDSFRCSKEEMVIARTAPDENADILSSIRHSIKRGTSRYCSTLAIQWHPPKNPNGMILAFVIEYQQRDTDSNNIKTKCVTYTDYESANRTHSIENIGPGSYMFRIRAISLFGMGPPSEFFSFDIVNNSEDDVSPMEVIFIILVVLVVLGLVFLSSYFIKIKNDKLTHVLIAGVNPYYVPNYIPDHYEVDRENVDIHKVLGIGSFGKVYKGVLKPDNIACAIKTVSEDASEDTRNDFLLEATMMKSMSKAFYIVNLLGVVSVGSPPLVLMELMELGDLKTYLRSVRDLQPLTTATMIKMAIEIADAMTFMEAHKFIHRDLAARNCMVKSDLTIKVGDFGMARDIYETDYYRKKSFGFLPIRWMAPESLKDGEFTNLTDVWSYGVVLWELASMAEQPYQGSSNEQVLHDVVAGRRLQVPKQTPLPLKSIMKSCFRFQPTKRSSFMHIVGSLEYYHDEEFKNCAYYYSKEAAAQRNSEWEYVEMQSVDDPLLDKQQSQTPGDICSGLVLSSAIVPRPSFTRHAVLSIVLEEDSCGTDLP